MYVVIAQYSGSAVSAMAMTETMAAVFGGTTVYSV
jgi:hypothetical protein